MVERGDRLISEDALVFIRECVNEGRIFWTYHVNMRMKTRSIPRQFILGSVDNYEVIEEYPEDKYFPSYLVYTKHRDTVLHIQFATDIEGQNVRIITAYHPSSDEWDKEFKLRRQL